MSRTVLSWRDLLDLDWAIERLLLDAAGDSPHCGSCGAALTNAGTCPTCDYRRR